MIISQKYSKESKTFFIKFANVFYVLNKTDSNRINNLNLGFNHFKNGCSFR